MTADETSKDGENTDDSRSVSYTQSEHENDIAETAYETSLPENNVMKYTLKNNFENVRRIFEVQANPEYGSGPKMAAERNYYGKNAVEMAIVLGRPKILNLFAKHDLPLNQKTAAGYSLLHLACSWGQVSSLLFLEERDVVDWTATTIHGETPEMIAIRYEKEEVEVFIKKAMAKMSLKTAINQVRERVGDPEKMQGVKLSKDDKAFIATACQDKLDWAFYCLKDADEEGKKHVINVEDIADKEFELRAQLQLLIDKAFSSESKPAKKDKDKGKEKEKDKKDKPKKKK